MTPARAGGATQPALGRGGWPPSERYPRMLSWRRSVRPQSTTSIREDEEGGALTRLTGMAGKSWMGNPEVSRPSAAAARRRSGDNHSTAVHLALPGEAPARASRTRSNPLEPARPALFCELYHRRPGRRRRTRSPDHGPRSCLCRTRCRTTRSGAEGRGIDVAAARDRRPPLEPFGSSGCASRRAGTTSAINSGDERPLPLKPPACNDGELPELF